MKRIFPMWVVYQLDGTVFMGPLDVDLPGGRIRYDPDRWAEWMAVLPESDVLAVQSLACPRSVREGEAVWAFAHMEGSSAVLTVFQVRRDGRPGWRWTLRGRSPGWALRRKDRTFRLQVFMAPDGMLAVPGGWLDPDGREIPDPLLDTRPFGLGPDRLVLCADGWRRTEDPTELHPVSIPFSWPFRTRDGWTADWLIGVFGKSVIGVRSRMRQSGVPFTAEKDEFRLEMAGLRGGVKRTIRIAEEGQLVWTPDGAWAAIRSSSSPAPRRRTRRETLSRLAIGFRESFVEVELETLEAPHLLGVFPLPEGHLAVITREGVFLADNRLSVSHIHIPLHRMFHCCRHLILSGRHSWTVIPPEWVSVSGLPVKYGEVVDDVMELDGQAIVQLRSTAGFGNALLSVPGMKRVDVPYIGVDFRPGRVLAIYRERDDSIRFMLLDRDLNRIADRALGYGGSVRIWPTGDGTFLVGVWDRVWSWIGRDDWYSSAVTIFRILPDGEVPAPHRLLDFGDRWVPLQVEQTPDGNIVFFWNSDGKDRRLFQLFLRNDGRMESRHTIIS